MDIEQAAALLLRIHREHADRWQALGIQPRQDGRSMVVAASRQSGQPHTFHSEVDFDTSPANHLQLEVPGIAAIGGKPARRSTFQDAGRKH